MILRLKQIRNLVKKLYPKKRTDKENMTNAFPSKKKRIKEAKKFKQHDDVVNNHIPYSFEANTSPHIIVKQWFHRIEKISIILSLHREQKIGKSCQML